MRRRDFLKQAGCSAALLGLSRKSWSANAIWGGAPDKISAELLLGRGVRANNVLEVFLYGGLSPFESFYVVEEYGRNDSAYPGEQFYLFEQEHREYFDRCDIPEQMRGLQPFAKDSQGMMVNLGPFAAPLRARPDILARMRIIVHRHDLEPHEAAIPYALSGFRLGSARMAGMGAAVQRYFQERDKTGRRIPYSYVLYPDTLVDTDNLVAASSVGMHPGSARPLDLRVTFDNALPQQLNRARLGDRREAHDALVGYYARAARGRYANRGGQPLRAPGVEDHAFATEILRESSALREVFTDDVLNPVDGSSCGDSEFSRTATGLQIAAHLLTHPTAPARHITLFDGGLIEASGGGGYDVHTDHMMSISQNLTHTLKEMAARINAPGEDDPGKIDLDRTMVILNTEFGRTPFEQAGGNGTNHHPYGYVSVMFGGPIGEAQAGVLGAIGSGGMANAFVTPGEARAAVLAAMGIYPFTNASFAVGDIRDIATERDGLAWLNEIVLGRR
ncbi:MAG: DUF1501 domain-containing protein [Myxococcota bacterium]